MTDELRMDAYYYGFDKTGIDAIDRVLSAVACAGKAYHHTEQWQDATGPYRGHDGRTPVDWIQNAANLCGEDVRAMIASIEKQGDEIARLRSVVEFFANREIYKPDATGRFTDLADYAEKALEKTE